MVISLNPVLVDLGGWAVRWYGVLALVGLVAGIAVALRGAERAGLSRAAILDALAWAVPIGVLSARLAFVLGWWDAYLIQPSDIWQLGLDGLSLWGGLVGGGLAAAARLQRDPVLRRDSEARRRIFDAAAPGLALAIAIGQLGAFIDGRGQGVSTSLPWATQYTSPLSATPDFGVPRHPMQLYDLLVALALLALVWGISARRGLFPRPGLRTALILGGLSLARLALGPLRLEPAFLFGLQIEQLLAFGVLLVSVIYALSPRRRRIRPASAVQPRDQVAA